LLTADSGGSSDEVPRSSSNPVSVAAVTFLNTVPLQLNGNPTHTFTAKKNAFLVTWTAILSVSSNRPLEEDAWCREAADAIAGRTEQCTGPVMPNLFRGMVLSWALWSSAAQAAPVCEWTSAEKARSNTCTPYVETHR
jgi:hypothetical protein